MSENPYATPRAESLIERSGMTRDDALALRQQFRSVERLLRSIGLVYFAQALAAVLVAFFLLTSGENQTARTLSAAVYCFALSLTLLVAGYSLRQLAPWARLTALLQTLYLLAGFMLGLYAMTVDGRVGFVFAVLHALPFYVLFSSRAAFVLSARYADVVALTAGERPGSWPLALGIMLLLGVLVLLDSVLLAPMWRT